MHLESMTRADLLNATVDLVNARIEKPMDRIETEALAFVIDKTPVGVKDASTLLRKQFSIEEKDASRDVKWKIHDAIHKAKMQEIQRLIEENLENPEEIEKLRAMRNFMESLHVVTLGNYQKPEHEVYLGGVPGEWLPAWFDRSLLKSETVRSTNGVIPA